MNNNTGTKSNTGKLFCDEDEKKLIKTATVQFTVIDERAIVMNKTVNNHYGCFFSGDTVVFTIVIKNLGSVALKGLFFSDVIDPVVIPLSGNEFQVTTTSGKIVQKTSTVKIEDISLAAQGTVTITIIGKIA